MSLNNSYMFGTHQRGGQSAMDPQMHLQSGPTSGGGIQLDMSSLSHPSNNGHGGHTNAAMQNNSRLIIMQRQQQQQQQQQQPHISTVSLQQHPPQQQTKKAKDQALKTPLSLLNEICSKAKTVPVFALEESGPVHLRVYNCSVKVDTQGFVCEALAVGKTKKDAKQEAAKALLLKMDNQVEKFLIPKPPKEEPTALIEVDADVPGNPVGDLNDLCTKLKRLPPEYEDVAECGKPHERVYTVACKLGSHIVETGRGRSKRHAKKAAASRVHKRVLEIMAKDSNEANLLKEEDNLIEKLSTLTLVKKEEAKMISDGWKLTDWVADLKQRSGPKIEMLRMEKDVPQPRLVSGDPIKMLKEISEEQKFKLDFTELDQGNNDSKTCLIAVSAGNKPITVLMGSAESKTQAKKVAAESFLDMLRSILISK